MSRRDARRLYINQAFLDAIEAAVVVKHQKTLAMGDQVLATLPVEQRVVLSSADSSEQELLAIAKDASLRTLSDDLSLIRLRCALAVAEGVEAIDSMQVRAVSGKDLFTLRSDGSLLNGEKQVPPEFFAEKIALHARVPQATALALWQATTQVILDGGVDFPADLSITKAGPDKARIGLPAPTAP